MSFAKYAQFYKDNGFFAGSKIKCTVTDTTFIGEELILSKDNEVIRSMTIPTSGKVEFFTDESGELTLSADNGTSTLSGSVEITNYATYNVILDGSASDNQRNVYADKTEITIDNETSSDTVNISYTGDRANMSVVSSNPAIATATLNGNKVNVVDAGSDMMGTADITVTVGRTRAYQEKSININVTKTNGTLDKTTWKGLKNIVESGRESELCQVGDEIDVTLSNGSSITYIIGAIDHDYDNQIIFVPKRGDYLGRLEMNRVTADAKWKNTSLRSYLNTTFFSMLPDDVQNVISPKHIEYAISNTELDSVDDLIWIPREGDASGEASLTYDIEKEISRIQRFKCFQDAIVTLKANSFDAIWLLSVSNGTPQRYSVSMYNYSDSGNSYRYTTAEVGTQRYPFPCFHIIKET